ncbi:MAG: hypothetical protein II307_03855, partial [Alistipes sp.]|nr:hypothetical protein [Alistipes sp.]
LTIEYLQRQYDQKLYLMSEIELPIIQSGDTTRIRWVFDNSVIAHIEVEGICETTPQDIQKGYFDVTVSPKETTLYRVNVKVITPDGTILTIPRLDDHRVIVTNNYQTFSKVMHNYMDMILYKKYKKLSQFMNSYAGGVREGKYVYFPEKLNEYLDQISGEGTEMQLADIDIPDTKTLLQRETERFDSVKLYPGKWLSTSLEHAVIARGDSTRIKFVFDNREVYGIQVLGYGKASRDDIKKGEYVVTVSPPKTKLIGCWVIKKGWRRIPAHYRVIVVDPEKYNEVMRKYYTLRAQGRSNRQYLNELADGVPER